MSAPPLFAMRPMGGPKALGRLYIVKVSLDVISFGYKLEP